MWPDSDPVHITRRTPVTAPLTGGLVFTSQGSHTFFSPVSWSDGETYVGLFLDWYMWCHQSDQAQYVVITGSNLKCDINILCICYVNIEVLCPQTSHNHCSPEPQAITSKHRLSLNNSKQINNIRFTVKLRRRWNPWVFDICWWLQELLNILYTHWVFVD